MTEAEVFQFSDVVSGLRRVFPKRMEASELREMDASYFKALRRFSLHQVQVGAEIWVQRGKYFPKPAEWIEAIPRREPTPDIPTMSDDQAHAYRRAEALRYEDQPCYCEACRRADITDKPLRFVPEFDARDRAVQMRLDDRVVTAGHWAHGAELARWYQAKGSFYDAYLAALAKKRMPTSGPTP